jgi:RNA polymerase sigma factor (sigma-70 family)
LAADARGGDRGALEALWERYHAATFRYARRRALSDALAQDAAAEAFSALASALLGGRGPTENVPGYLCATVRNYLSRQAARNVTVEIGAVEPRTLETSRSDEEDGVICRDAILSALRSLPPRSRDVLVGLDVQGMTIQELAVAWNTSVNNICQIHSRARRQLRDLLDRREREALAC